MKIFILIATFISLKAHAFNYPYLGIKDKDFKLSNYNFQRYVISQSKNLLGDFYSVLKKLNPLQENVITLKNEVLKLEYNWKLWSENCPNLAGECRDTFEKIYEQARKLDIQILKFKEKSLNLKKVKAHSIDQTLKLERSLDYLLSLNYNFLHTLEEINITSQTSFGRLGTTISRTLLPLLNEMKVFSELQMANQLSGDIKDLFYFVWENFFKRLERHIVFEQKKVYLKNNLGELNMIWNTFHMKALKGNIKLDPKINRAITTMHSRWNSILKVTL